jgi:hypothetical protein
MLNTLISSSSSSSSSIVRCFEEAIYNKYMTIDMYQNISSCSRNDGHKSVPMHPVVFCCCWFIFMAGWIDSGGAWRGGGGS